MDATLVPSLGAALSAYREELDRAQLEATQLAASRRVQQALDTRDRRAVGRIARAHPNVLLRLPWEAHGAATEPQRSVDVVLGGKRVGTVVVGVPLDSALLARLVHRAGLTRLGEVVAVLRNARVVASSSAHASGDAGTPGSAPETIRVGDRDFRAVATELMPATRLAVLVPTRAVDTAARSVRVRVLLIGLAVLAAVMLLGYLLAPVIGRARVGQRQRALAERVLGHVADGVVLLDADGNVRFWNRAAEAITGVPARRVLGARADEAVAGWRAAAEQVPVVEAAAPNSSATPTVTVPIESDGGEIWIEASAVRFEDGTVYTFRDITEAERLDQAKADFVATVSHELRTPLASVYGAAMTLRHHDARLAASQREGLLELLAEQGERMSGIIDDILLASKLDSGRLEIEHESFDPGDVARRVVEAARIRGGEGISIELSLPGWLPTGAGDADMVSQVLANLVENAVKYSPGGGRVDVVVEQHDDRVRFEVRDEGLGIPLGAQEQIFEKFYRLDPNLTRGIGGTGLGLYISSELVRRMGGEIHVSSAPGQGSTFWFELPLAPAVQPAVARS